MSSLSRSHNQSHEVTHSMMQFCDHKRSSRHCGFYSPQVSSLDNIAISPISDMREVVREDEDEEDEYVRCDSDAEALHFARDTPHHVTRVPAPLARILDRHVSTCPVLVSHLLASHYSTR